MAPFNYTHLCDMPPTEKLRTHDLEAVRYIICLQQNTSTSVLSKANPAYTMLQTQLLIYLWRENQSWLNRYKFAIAGIGIFIILMMTLGLWYLYYSITNWGRWKQRDEGAPEYVKTGFGWITREKYDRRLVKNARKKEKKKHSSMWRTTTADYSWIFWDPTGEGRQRWDEERANSWLKYLPKCLRSYPHGSMGKPIIPANQPQADHARDSRTSLPSIAASQLYGLDISSTLTEVDRTSDHNAGTVHRRRLDHPDNTAFKPRCYSTATTSNPSFHSAASNPHSSRRTSQSTTLEIRESGQGCEGLHSDDGIGISDFANDHYQPSSPTPPPPDVDTTSRSSTPPHRDEPLHVPRKRKAMAPVLYNPHSPILVTGTRSLPTPIRPLHHKLRPEENLRHRRPYSWTAGDETFFRRNQTQRSSTIDISNAAEQLREDRCGLTGEMEDYEAESELDDEISERDFSL